MSSSPDDDDDALLITEALIRLRISIRGDVFFFSFVFKNKHESAADLQIFSAAAATTLILSVC